MDTKLDNEKNIDIWLALMDRLLKATHTKKEIAEVILGIKKLRREGEKVLLVP